MEKQSAFGFHKLGGKEGIELRDGVLEVDDLAVFDVAVLGCGGGRELSGGGVGEGVGNLLDHAAVAGEGDGDLDGVVEVHRALVADGDAGNRGEDSQ